MPYQTLIFEFLEGIGLVTIITAVQAISRTQQGPATGSEKVVRGGAFMATGDYARTAFRIVFSPSVASYIVGIRCAAPLVK